MPLVRRAKNPRHAGGRQHPGTFGLLFVIQGVAAGDFGGQYYSYSYLVGSGHVLGSTVAINRLLALVFAAVIGGVLYLVLTRTRYGTALRAVAVDPVAAQLVAIDVRRASALAFALGGALVAAGGVLVSMFLTFNAAMGVVFTMKALIVVIMGGVGNMLGALVAGLLLGLAETAVARLVDPGPDARRHLRAVPARPAVCGRPACSGGRRVECRALHWSSPAAAVGRGARRRAAGRRAAITSRSRISIL